MLIRNIEIENFKSFKTLQRIAPGLKNVVIGKNGSGKSNILAALSVIFNPEASIDEYGVVGFNGNEEPTTIIVEIDNSDKRFLLPNSFTIKFTHSMHKVEYSLNGSSITKEELKGLYENAGFTKESFVEQGKVNNIAVMSGPERFRFIERIAGADKYEDSKDIAYKMLDEEKEERIEDLIEKIEMKMKITEDYRRKVLEYDNLLKDKLDKEYELMKHEIIELNEKISKNSEISLGENGLLRNLVDKTNDSSNTGLENMELYNDEGFIEIELKNCTDEINHLKHSIEEEERFLKRFDRNILDGLQNNELGYNSYTEKIRNLEKRQEALLKNLEDAEKSEREKYIELKAVQYFNALGKNKEEVKILEREKENIKAKIGAFESGNLCAKKAGTYAEDSIRKRKEYFIKQKKLRDELIKLREEEKSMENKILYLGKHSINVYERIKGRKGVHGTVYSLFSVPENLLTAYEAVTKNSLFWIVVSDENVATSLIKEIDGVGTFVALSRVSPSEPTKEMPNLNLVRLSDKIKCSDEYKPLLSLVCKNYFVCPDLKSAISYSEKYNVNVVTTEGDICNRNGAITGGYEKSNTILRDLKLCQERILAVERDLKEVEDAIKMSNVENTLKSDVLGDDSDFESSKRILDDLLAVEMYLDMKIKFMKVGKISLPDVFYLKSDHFKIAKNIPILKLELSSVQNQLERTLDKKENLDKIIEAMKTIERSKEKLLQLTNLEKKLIEMIYNGKASYSDANVQTNFALQQRHMLIDKRSTLMKKMGLKDFQSIFPKSPKDTLILELKEVNTKLKQFAGFNRKELYDDQRVELRNRLEDLKNSKAKILEFISTLDQKKEDTLNLTFSMISDNYSYFYREITGDNSVLVLKDHNLNDKENIRNSNKELKKSVEIMTNGNLVDINLLSGGQKTVIALCLIFAVQKNDPSPFYVFDEIDANLDKAFCDKLYQIIGKSTAQYFITSFKEESLVVADKFFGVVSKNKESFIDEIDQSLAYETISCN